LVNGKGEIEEESSDILELDTEVHTSYCTEWLSQEMVSDHKVTLVSGKSQKSHFSSQ
jgi:hypothetical protein